MKHKVIFIFLDGVGVGAADGNNPFYFTNLPFIESLIKKKLILNNEIVFKNILFKGIDACLGVPGIPQSATGQTTLFTGINAAEYLGYHYPAFPNEPLKKLIDNYSIFKQVTDKGFTATFANAYTPDYFNLVKEGKRQHSVTTLSVYASELNFRNLNDLMNGNAVYWDITNEYINKKYTGYAINIISPYIAGGNLAGLSYKYDLVIFECFLPDIIGHKRDRESAEKFLLSLDDFIHGIVTNMEPNTTLIITSDHGNIENLDNSGHTCNPVLFLAIGNIFSYFENIKSIHEVASIIMKILLCNL